MNKLNIPYTLTEGKVDTNLAAGFPPYTRGYKTHLFTTECIYTEFIFKEDNQFTNYSLNALNSDTVIDLFYKIISNKITLENTKSIYLEFPFAGTINDIAHIRCLRTLLAFVCDHIFNIPNKIEFTFIAKIKNPNFVLENYTLAKSAQIDFVYFPETSQNTIKTLLKYTHPTPTDVFCGNKQISETTEQFFSHIWPIIVDKL